jgi:23S rRNA-/tRNA-specific pseudouridylate synthase
MHSNSYTVASIEEGLSLLQFLKGKLEHSGKEVKRAIDANACYINGKIERFSSRKLKKNDLVLFYLDKFEKVKAGSLELLHKDPYFIAYNKPPFYVCEGEGLLHRLDKETSGVWLHSQDPRFFDLFRLRKIEKRYLAVVEGVVKEQKGKIENKLGVVKTFSGQKIMGHVKDGKYALTEWKVIKRGNGLTLLECNLKTGRTHQIRTHLASVGMPIIGDFQYGKTSKIRVGRILLHAHTVSFVHPATAKKVKITAPVPEDMKIFST